MKGLDTLIKLHRRTLDELRKQIAVLENQKAQLLLASQKLEQELKDEMQAASAQVEMSGFFGGFAKRIRTRQAKIAQEIKELDKKLATLADAAQAAYGEVKKFEIARERKRQRALKEAERKETIRLDEIAGQQDRRKKSKTPA